MVIVESPTKARTLTKFLGAEYQIEASMGHLRDLPKKKIGVDIEHDFTPEYVIVEGKAATVAKLKKLAKGAAAVILATDPDREGEAIAFHIETLLKTKNLKLKFSRIVFHEITQSAISAALDHPGEVDLKLVDAQYGRRVLDRLVGYKLSPLLWQKVRRGLSAGRVQSVAVRLVVEREEEIRVFQPEAYWVVGAVLAKNKAEFPAYLKKINREEEAQTAAETLTNTEYLVKNVQTRPVKQWPFPPFTTASLQRTAGTRFGWSAKKTMRTAQSLYEQGLITYHRTDSVNLAQEAVEKARDYIKQKFGQAYLPDKGVFYKSGKKNVQGAHEAIRPTDLNFQSEDKLYQLIRERFISCQMNPAIINKTKVVISADKYELVAEGEKLVFAGFTKISNFQYPISNELPNLQAKDKLDLIKVINEKKFTLPPARYTEAALIKVLEQKGIGRPSTYAPILSTIQDRFYVEKKEQKLFPTAIGAAVVKFLLTYFPKIMDYEFTAGMEQGLDEIAEGKQRALDLLKNFYSDFNSNLINVKEKAQRTKIEAEATGQKCPECQKRGLPAGRQGEVVIRTGRFGKFYSCSRFPECKYTKNYKELVSNAVCPDCGAAVVIRKSRRGRQFYGCDAYPKCKWMSWQKP